MRTGLGFLILAFMTLAGTKVSAQDDGYLMEAGLAGGGSFYMGDANTRMFRNTNGVISALLRYNVNPRFSLKANLSAAGISGESENSFGALPAEGLRFSRTLYDFGVQIEWGFCGYSLYSVGDCHRLAPYGVLGIGATFAPKPQNNDFAVNFPVGLGLRYKLSERLNLGLEWTMRFSSSDRLDVTQDVAPGLENPFMIKGKGMKNKDSYSFTMLYVTFDVFKRPCHCNDEKEK
ncbi:MAG: porin family protein [Bacteroidaceae bacterium]|nr:outer membrane beta-barrel protein [Candidatus Colenecus caballi]MCQ2072583.1 porin family protein [Bacteroidaceae bacterium]